MLLDSETIWDQEMLWPMAKYMKLPKPKKIMQKKFILWVFLLLACMGYSQSGPGSLKGIVTDAKTGETIPQAVIKIIDAGGGQVTYGTADFNGKYHINPIEPGVYSVEISCIGMEVLKLENIRISSNHITVQDIKLSSDNVMLGPVNVGDRLIDKAEVSSKIEGKELTQMPGRDIVGAASNKPGVYKDPSGNLSIKAGRPETTSFYIDGVKVRGNPAVNQAMVGEIEVITGGIPAPYGDVTGGIISTTTKGPSPVTFGNVEFVTSSLFDKYNYNLFAFTLGAPIWKKEKQTLASFILSTEFEYAKEPAPTYIPYAQLDDSKRTELEQNPLVVNPTGQGIFYKSEFITEDDLSDIKARRNSYTNELRLMGNLNLKTSKLTHLTLGGRWIYSNDKGANRFHHIYNYGTNMNQINSDWTARARFQQSFKNDPKAKSLIKNIYYSIQADYTQNRGEVKDSRYGTDFFKYGHIGSFDVHTLPSYAWGTDSVSGISGYRFIGDSPNGVSFQQGPNNTIRGNYARHYFELAEQFPSLLPATVEELMSNNIPINGTNPDAVYGLWGSPGASQGNYSKYQNGQFRLTASSNFDIDDHSLIIGFEYEKRTDRAYSLNATGLWTQMRLLQNRPNQELDLSKPIFVKDVNGVYQDTINYNYVYSPNDASTFAENIRETMGLDKHNTSQINILNMDPALFSLDMFSADELINPNGASYTSYYGFDYTGNLVHDNVSTSDFFTATNSRGDLSRPVGAFQPIYMAGYVQDKFTFKDLVFNVGVRVDRFDLNQEVLKDPYVLFPTYRVRDLGKTELPSDARTTVPSSIGGDYVVYVNSFDYASASIVGYRNPENNQWFDANGTPIANPQLLSDAAGGGIKPLLVNSPLTDENATKSLSAASFKDYDPQVVVMPRISFNFPINDEALFTAHYDVLAQRPLAAYSRSNPFNYLNLINKNAGGILSNPDLKPQVTTEYELGFKQALTDRSTLKISAFYRELRDMVQTTAFTQAYPITYVAYTNVDFATTKGFTLEYDLRRVKNVRLSANYTLQFGNGTGSNANSGASLASSGQPNLRYILPLDQDTRHQISVLGDYRYGQGDDYHGPVWWNTRVFENAGINLVMNARSGNPYTKRVDFRPNAQIDGQVNGARLPWQLTFDARINKLFKIKDSENSIEVYFQILNLFNTQNVVGVYAFTGSPDDNGFLSSATAQSQIAEQASAQSFMDLYNRSINNPGNYGLPRQIRLGLNYNF